MTKLMFKNVSRYKLVVVVTTIIYFLYGWGLASANYQFELVSALVVCALSIGIILFLDVSEVKDRHLTFFLVTLHISFYLGALVSGGSETILWGEDSHLYHIPASINFTNDLSNFLSSKEYFTGRVLPIHIVTGLMFKIFGVNTFSSTLATLLFKVPSLLLIIKLGESLFSRAVGKKSALVYILLPSVFMFSAVFFKEVSIQLYVVAFFYFFHRYNIHRDLTCLFISLGALLFIGYERIYIFPGVTLGVATWFIYKIYTKSIDKKTLGFIFLMTVSGIVFASYFIPILKVDNIFHYIREQREVYLGLEGVTKWNKIIPFPLTFFKILLAPFFTPNKFDSFKGTLFLILWSAPFVNLLMGGMFYEMIRSTLKKPKLHLPILFTVIGFLLLLAYVRPYDARVRDSLAPIFVIYFCSFLSNSSKFKRMRNFIEEVSKHFFQRNPSSQLEK